MKKKAIVVKRYSNRKLYCKTGYISLLELGGLFGREQDVTVIDHPTGKDITPQILLSVLLKREIEHFENNKESDLYRRLLKTSGSFSSYIRSLEADKDGRA